MDSPERFEILAIFDAQFPGKCIINRDHRIRYGESVARVQRADNPFLPVTGVVCYRCLKMIPRASK